MNKKTYGFKRKALVPDLDGTHAKECPKCHTWYAAPLRSRICDGCQPAWKLAKRSDQPERHLTENTPTAARVTQVNEVSVQVTEPENDLSDAEKFRRLCIWWAGRASVLKAWLEATGLPVRDYPRFGDLTSREVAVGIGWVPWPVSWPARSATKRQLKTVIDDTPAVLLARRAK